MVTQATPHQWSGHAIINDMCVCVCVCVNRIRDLPLLRNLTKYNIPSSSRSLVMQKSPYSNDNR